MYPHCTVRIRLLYAFDKYFDFGMPIYFDQFDSCKYNIEAWQMLNYYNTAL